jgi:hypothetical protein
MILCLTAGLLSALAVAAPVPKEREADKIARMFGAPADPDKDCKFELGEGGKLVIRAPAAVHVLNPAAGGVNAPRVVRTVEGDFTATVRIRMVPTREPQAGPANGQPMFLAGMTLGQDDATLLSHARTVQTQGNEVKRAGLHLEWVGGQQRFSASSGGGAFDPETTYLRITRTGPTIKLAASADGKGWHEFNGPVVSYPAKAKIGLFVANPSGEPFAAEFDQLTIAAPAAKPEK